MLHPDGRAALVNRAALRLAGAEVNRLEQIAAVGAEGARTVLALRTGTRQVVSLADGRQMFVVGLRVLGARPFAATVGCSPRALPGDLDAVELKAWQDMVQVLAHEMMNSLTPISSLSESLEGLLQERRADERALGQ